MRYVIVDTKLFIKYIDSDGKLKLFNLDELIENLINDLSYIDESTEIVKLILEDLRDGKLKYE